MCKHNYEGEIPKGEKGKKEDISTMIIVAFCWHEISTNTLLGQNMALTYSHHSFNRKNNEKKHNGGTGITT